MTTDSGNMTKSNDHFESVLRGKLDELDEVWNDLLVIDWSEEKLKEVQKICHILAEISGNFGYAQFGKTARKLDEMVHSLLLNP